MPVCPMNIDSLLKLYSPLCGCIVVYLHNYRVGVARRSPARPYMEVPMNIDELLKFVQASMGLYCSVCSLWSERGLCVRSRNHGLKMLLIQES